MTFRDSPVATAPWPPTAERDEGAGVADDNRVIFSLPPKEEGRSWPVLLCDSHQPRAAAPPMHYKMGMRELEGRMKEKGTHEEEQDAYKPDPSRETARTALSFL